MPSRCLHTQSVNAHSISSSVFDAWGARPAYRAGGLNTTGHRLASVTASCTHRLPLATSITAVKALMVKRFLKVYADFARGTLGVKTALYKSRAIAAQHDQTTGAGAVVVTSDEG